VLDGYLNWFKSYDTNANKHKPVKNAKNGKNITQITKFFTKWKKMGREVVVFCVITFEPIKI
jgi:hypothetical protein